MSVNYSDITPYLHRLAARADANNGIEPHMYPEHNVKRGLRDVDGSGVVAGLTEVSKIVSQVRGEDGKMQGCPGRLYYRGINVRDLVDGFLRDNRFGFEETVYLLLFSKLPTARELPASCPIFPISSRPTARCRPRSCAT